MEELELESAEVKSILNLARVIMLRRSTPATVEIARRLLADLVARSQWADEAGDTTWNSLARKTCQEWLEL